MEGRRNTANCLVTLIASIVLVLLPMQASAQTQYTQSFVNSPANTLLAMNTTGSVVESSADTSPVNNQEAQAEAVAGPSTTLTTCVFTGTIGLKICSPTAGSTVTSPVHVVADAKSVFRQMDVSIDGVHRYGVPATHVDVFLSATVGTHTLRVCTPTIVILPRVICQSVSFTVAPSSSCSAPSSVGVHVCSPIDGSTMTSPVHALARGLVSGTFARMELWVDGVKRLNSSTTKIDTFVTLRAGSHRFNFRAVNTAGMIWSKVVNVTVK